MKSIYLLCGPPASGKSTFALKCIGGMIEPCAYISRDSIRFSKLKDNEKYFAHENEVFKTFINKINDALNDEDIQNIFIDATHINEISRNKTLSRLNLNNTDIYPIYFNTSKDVCIERNAKRVGLKKVPDDVIVNMCNTFIIPSNDEKYKYKQIIDGNRDTIQ